MRKLSENLFKELKYEKRENGEKSKLHVLLEYVKADDTLDMEFRGNSFTLYYRGGALLTVEDNSDGTYNWKGINEEYFLEGKDRYDQKHKDAEQFDEYIPEAKHIIDRYICIGPKNHLGEKEIQQLVVKENNYSQNSNDTDYFIVDMEYEEGRSRFDLIALRWDSNGISRQKNKVSLAVIEVKQGYRTIKTSKKCPGLRKHQKDFNAFIENKQKAHKLDAFRQDMLMIFKQKCELKLIRGNEKMQKITYSSDLQLKTPEIDFICLLANYKDKSRALEIEFIGMDECKFIKSSYAGYGLYANNVFTMSPKYRNMNDEYKKAEKQEQVHFYYEQRKLGSKGVFGNAENNGHYIFTNKERKNFNFILKPANSKNNLFACIRDNALDYFEKHKISWWRQEEDGYFPSGHLISSQIHCLNHLFALRTDKYAVKLIIEKATGVHFDHILSSLIDDDPESYISFEFVFHNDEWLQENDEGAKRGTICTSIDAMILAEKDGAKWLIPIEWKFTERYDREDKTNRKRLKRYKHLIESSKRLQIPDNGIAHSAYFIEPNYELMRQTLLCEQIIEHGYAKDFFHINIIPTKNTELRKAVETEFIPMLTKEAKFKIIDPQDFLSPLKGNDKYKDLLNYLETRYWKYL